VQVGTESSKILRPFLARTTSTLVHMSLAGGPDTRDQVKSMLRLASTDHYNGFDNHITDISSELDNCFIAALTRHSSLSYK
jgi:hypothetical protein